MLRAEGDDGGLVDDVGKMLGMLGREAVVTAAADVVQLVERVAVGEPGLAFLVGAEQVAVAVEGQVDAEAVTRADDLAALAVGRDA